MNLNRLISGYVDIIVTGEALEKILNIALNQGLLLWDVKRLAANQAICRVPLYHLWSFIQIVRQNKVQMKVTRRTGFPFVLNRAKKRKGMILGCCLFFSLIYLTLSFVWSYQVIGNEHYSDEQIIGLIQSYGIIPGAGIKNFDYTAVQKRLLIDYPHDFKWVDIRPIGTKIRIEIKEKEKPDLEDPRPAHLIAKKEGVVKELLVFKGTAQVVVESRVNAGQVLIAGLEYKQRERNEAGVYDNAGIPEMIRAKGIVFGHVEYSASGSCKLQETNLQNTGRQEKQLALAYHEQRFILQGVKQSSFTISRQEITTKNLLSWQDYISPVRFIESFFFEQIPVEKNYTPEDAYHAAVERAREKIRDKIGTDQEFVAEKIRLVPQDNAQMVQVEVTWTVLENLAEAELITNNSSS